MKKNALLRTFSFVIAVLFAATSLIASNGSAAAQGKTTLVFGLGNNVDTLDPNTTTFSSVGSIMIHVVEGLVAQPKLGTFEPGLAESWIISPDVKEYTFKLRKDVKFHDGTPFNAAAVKFTYDRIANPETKAQTAASLLGPYDSAVVVDDSTITVKFKSPFAPFLASASNSYLGIVSPDAFAKAGADWGKKTIVGTGPFKVESYTPTSQVVLVRNDAYNWAPKFQGVNGPAKLTKITYKIVLEPATRLAALESGEVDIINDTPETDVKRIRDEKNFTQLQIEQPGSGWTLMMNVTKFPTDQLAVRKAIALGSDKQGMIDTVFNGLGTPGCSPITKVMFGYDPKTCEYLPYSVAEAKKTLEADGWKLGTDGFYAKDGKQLAIDHHFRSDSPRGVAMATFMESDLKKIGVKVNLFGAAQAGYFDAVRAGKHNSQNWWDTATTPDAMLRTLFWSKNAEGGTNRNRYKSATVDKLLDDAAATADPAKQKELYAQIQKVVVADDVVMVYFNDPFILYSHVTNLQGFVPLGGGNYLNFYAASFK